MAEQESLLAKLAGLSREEIRRGISRQQLLTMQIVHVAMVIGTLLFLGMNLMLEHLAGNAQPTTPQLPEQVRIILLLMGPLALACYLAASLLPRFVLSPQAIAKSAGNRFARDNPVAWAVQRLQTARILLLALLDGPALFGLVGMMMGIMGRHLEGHPELWLTLLPLGVQVLVTVITFPGRQWLEEQVEQKVVEAVRHAARIPDRWMP